MATAVDRIRPGVGGRALGRLQSPGATVGAGIDELLNGMAAHREPIAVVLDDLHSLSDEPALQSFEYAVERLPPGTRIIATTRTDPRIRLGRLRARGELAEVRARDLAFTLDEARELLVVREGIALDDDDLSHLLERSEGWPAGLYLAALWLRGHSDPRAGARDFTGDHRHVADYLLGEVIDALDEATRDFLLRTSVLPRLSGARATRCSIATAAARSWPSSRARTCSSSHWTRGTSGTGTTTSSGSCCAWSCPGPGPATSTSSIAVRETGAGGTG